jgi:AMIN domain
VSARGYNRSPAIDLRPARSLAPVSHRSASAIGALIFLALIAPALSAGTSKPDPHAAAQPVVSASAHVRQVKVAENGSTTQVIVTGDGHLSCRVMHFTDPERIVLDFAGTQLALPKSSSASTLDPVTQVRMSQFKPSVTRVVIDLARPSKYHVETRGNEVAVNFATDKSLAEAAPVASAAVATVSNSDQPPSDPSAKSSEGDATATEQAPAASGAAPAAQAAQTSQTESSSGNRPFASQQPQPAGAGKPRKGTKKAANAVDTRWRTYDLDGVPQYGYHLWDTYNQNVIKGDFPLTDKWFTETDVFQNFTYKARRNLDFTKVLPENKFISYNNFEDESNIFGTEIRHNDDRFFPANFRFHIDGAVDWKNDINAFNAGSEGHAQVFDAFSDVQLHNFGSVNFNQMFLRGGLQNFKSDFHGLVFNDVGLGGRIFGNSLSNRLRYDFVFLKLFQKDAVSGLIDFEKASQHTVMISRFTWEDFLVKGWNSEWSVHWNHDPRKIDGSNSNLLNLDTYYVGTTLNGNLGRFIFNPAIYGVFGTADHLIDGEKVQHDVRAWTTVLDLEYPIDFWKLRVGYVYESGDNGNSTSKTDTGFDAISDAVTLFGGPISYWVGEDIKYGKGDFTRANSFDPSLRGTNNQANYINPGLQLVNTGFDATVTPRVALSFNLNWLYFNDIGTYATNNIVGGVATTTTIDHHNAGIEENIFIRWKPFLRQINDFVIIDTGFSVLQPLAGIKDAFGSSRPVYTFQVTPRVIF